MASNGKNGTNGLKPTGKTMKAQQYHASDNSMHLNEVPIPTPKPHEILVKIACASLCHSDVMLFEPNDQGLLLAEGGGGVTMGHEATGYVVEVGDGVKGLGVKDDFKAGDAVGFICPMECCFDCYPCREVHNNYCVTGKTKMQGFGLDGYFQEYAIVDARNTMVLPKAMDVHAAAPLFCAGVTSYHSIEDCKLKPGQWVAVIGCGGLGHLGIQYAKAMGLKVIALDIAPGPLAEAKNIGADHVFNSLKDTNYIADILSITSGGVDAAVNFTASKKSYDAAPAIIRPGSGILMVVGIPREPIALNALDVALGRYRVMGSNNGTCYNMRSCIEFSAEKGIVPHVEYYKLEELPEMVRLMREGKAIGGRMAVKF
ncbi:alcohol dehydrogenase [Aulographum hederae CBS 113979]|uniref:Alcohol dehydrogenase n=1 Tax=Aulographum hederae CBS 113979 TaxID=1176131 RepID=A0A6G1HGT2_9PEZI|nr:alcohol dehydrogenase [Aulographum hederae CBS 113979]